MQALGVVWGNIEEFAEEVQPLPAPVHFGARLLHDFWKEKAPQDGLVVGRDVPSRTLGPILRNLILYEPLDGGQDFRVRLSGAALLRRFGRDITGEKYSTLFPRDVAAFRSAGLREMLATGEPAFRDVTLPQGTRPALRYEVLNVPVLAADGVTPWILTGIFYHDWAG